MNGYVNLRFIKTKDWHCVMESYWINKWTITKFHAVQDFFKFKITLITVLLNLKKMR